MNAEELKIDPKFLNELIVHASNQLRLVFGMYHGVTNLEYPGVFTWGRHTVTSEELQLSETEEELAFSSLEHSAIYLAMAQIHTTLETIFDDPFHIENQIASDAFQISRLTRNAFAHNPFAPIWEVREVWRKKYDVPEIIRIDATNLDGKPVKSEHYGGPLSVFRLLEFVSSLIDKKLTQQNV